ncbi:MAG: Secretion system C-terminal sorting domain [Bacteroidota bacterium]|jgi:hypothetical protein
MKKLYITIAAALSMQFAQAQSAVFACKKADGEINIVFSLKKNCTATPAGSRDSLGKRDSIGFHSGANGWSAGKDWNAAGAVQGKRRLANRADSTFHVRIANPVTYYGLAAGTAVTDIQFVLNDGPVKPAAPWGSEGKEQDATTSCKNFLITIASLPTCVASAQDVRADVGMVIAPNPGQSSTTVFINNPKNERFSLLLTDATGRLVRQESVTGASVELNNLSAGLYFVILRDTEGRFSTEKVIME